MNEECGGAQVGEMLRALLLGAARRMKRVGEQYQARDQIGLLGAEHAALAASVGVPAEENLPRTWTRKIHQFLQCGDGIRQTGAVAGGVAGAGRAEGSRLAVGQIAAEHRVACVGERFGQGAEQWGLGVASRAVRQDHSVAIGRCRDVEKSADRRIDRGVGDLADGGFGQGIILNRRCGEKLIGRRRNMNTEPCPPSKLKCPNGRSAKRRFFLTS